MSPKIMKNPLHCFRRITGTEQWATEDIDLERPAFIKFDGDRMGEFHLILVHGWMDCRYGERGGKPAVEFSWDGVEEGNQCSGRGWAVLEG